jgi:hypothetical protein
VTKSNALRPLSGKFILLDKNTAGLRQQPDIEGMKLWPFIMGYPLTPVA